jgi:hypothetical protein
MPIARVLYHVSVEDVLVLQLNTETSLPEPAVKSLSPLCCIELRHRSSGYTVLYNSI